MAFFHLNYLFTYYYNINDNYNSKPIKACKSSIYFIIENHSGLMMPLDNAVNKCLG